MEVFSCCEDVKKYQNAKDHLAYTTGNGDPMHEDTSSMRTARVK